MHAKQWRIELMPWQPLIRNWHGRNQCWALVSIYTPTPSNNIAMENGALQIPSVHIIANKTLENNFFHDDIYFTS